jgi:uncharacterized protein YcnI
MRMPQRALAVSGLTVLALTVAASAASAHVTANPNTLAPGSYGKVSFRVPNEQTGADTTQLEVDLPMDHPIASVSVRPTPGWKITLTKSKLPTPLKTEGGEITQAVSKIVWTGGKIAPGEFQEFDVSMGPLPTNTPQLMFKALQTYSSGEVVKWDEPPASGGEEPEHPAPTIRLAADSSSAPMATMNGISARRDAATSKSDGTARLLGGLGLAAGLLGAAAGVYGLRRGRS